MAKKLCLILKPCTSDTSCTNTKIYEASTYNLRACLQGCTCSCLAHLQEFFMHRCCQHQLCISSACVPIMRPTPFGQTIVIPKTLVSEKHYYNYFPNYSYTFLGFYQKDKLYKNNIIFSAFIAFFMNSLVSYAYTTYSNLNTLLSSLMFCLDCTQSIVIVVFSSRMVCLD